MTDNVYLRHAIRLAAAQLGRTAPNPAVGCVMVKDERIVGVGATARGGRPHAETEALAMAGEDARGATAYVTLEPCSHTGQTGPCAQALIEAGVARVVIGQRDPKLGGAGIAMLQQADMEVIEGMEASACARLHEGFVRSVDDQRPLVSLKIATSLDGKMATASGQSQWITGKAARRYGHALRAQHDAILTGIGTVLADNPALTCRLPGREADSPARFVLDRQGRLPAAANVHPCAVLKDDLPAALHRLATEYGITRLLIEAGPTLSTAFLRAGLVDRLYWFRAPVMLGGDGRSGLDALEDLPLDAITRLNPEDRFSLGADVCEVYRITPERSR